MQSTLKSAGSAACFTLSSIKHDIELATFTAYYNHMKIKPGKLELVLSSKIYINNETICLLIQTKCKIKIMLIQYNYCY